MKNETIQKIVEPFVKVESAIAQTTEDMKTKNIRWIMWVLAMAMTTGISAQKTVLKAFDKMKETAILINVARGPVVDEQDLYDALTQGKIAAAGLDVLVQEPIAASNPLGKIKDSTKLIITPHMAWGSHEARLRCAREAYENIKAFCLGKERNIVV